MRLANTVLLVLVWLNCIVTSAPGQTFLPKLNDQDLFLWNFPEPTEPFFIHVDLWTMTESIQGFEMSLLIYGPLEVLSVWSYGDTPNGGTYNPLPSGNGAEQELFFPDFGTCFGPQTLVRLVTVELQFTRTENLCSSIGFGPYGEEASYLVGCDGLPRDRWTQPGIFFTIWCPDAVESTSFGRVKALF